MLLFADNFIVNYILTISSLKFKAVTFLGSVALERPTNIGPCAKQSLVRCKPILHPK